MNDADFIDDEQNVVRSAVTGRVSRPIRYLMALCGLCYLAQGWIIGRFLLRQPDPHPRRNRPDPPVDRLASHSGPPNEDRRASRDHIRRNDLVVPLADPLTGAGLSQNGNG